LKVKTGEGKQMKEHPILFSGAMVRAILDGRKTQTRRVVKVPSTCTPPLKCPYGEVGGRLWVRETWMPDAPRDGSWDDVAFYGCNCSPLSLIPKRFQKAEHCIYRSTWTGGQMVGWKPSIHMPRWASRITLEITAVRVERLQAITRDDAKAEGITEHLTEFLPGAYTEEAKYLWRNRTSVENFSFLWESVYGTGSWDADPWVWVVEFKVLPQAA